jgi:hypothetical protein
MKLFTRRVLTTLTLMHSVEYMLLKAVLMVMTTKEEKQVIFQEMHDRPIGGHLGMNKTYDRMKLFITWPGMKQELEEYIMTV